MEGKMKGGNMSEIILKKTTNTSGREGEEEEAEHTRDKLVPEIFLFLFPIKNDPRHSGPHLGPFLLIVQYGS